MCSNVRPFLVFSKKVLTFSSHQEQLVPISDWKQTMKGNNRNVFSTSHHLLIAPVILHTN